MKKLLPLIVSLLFMLDSSGTPFGLKNKISSSSPSSTIELMRMNVYVTNADGSSSWIDGAVTQYGADYSDAVDGDDGRKMINPGPNVCVLRDNINLVVERRQLIDQADTIFFKMWGLQKRTYEMRFIAMNLNHPGLKAYLQDNYLHTETPVQLNDTTHINIDINNDAGSYALDRFRLIYKNESPVAPIPHFIAISAFPDQGQILLNWLVENDNNNNQFFIQKSIDGSHFIDIAKLDSKDFPNGNFHWIDHFASSEYSYYRIKSVELNTTNIFSDIVKVNTPVATNNGISVFPNPAAISNFNLRMVNQPDGDYKLRIFNSSGTLIIQQKFHATAGINTVKIPINQTVAPGIYHLEIIKPDAERVVLNVVF